MLPEDKMKKIDLYKLMENSKLEELARKPIGYSLSLKDKEFLRDLRAKEMFRNALKSVPNPLGPWRW